MSDVVALVASLVGLVIAWLLTVPLFRFKEMRPMTPRDVSNEAGLEIRAVVRHARCPKCHRDHGPADVLPVVSWLRGCPGCGLRLPATVAVFQLALPLAAAITAIVFDPVWVVVLFVWFAVVVTSVAVVDARVWLIPWWAPWVGSAVGAVLMVIASLSVDDTQRLVWALAGAVGAFVVFFVLWFVAPGRLGFGDVRLSFMIGLFLGWIDPLLVVWGLLFGSVVGLIVGLWTLVVRKGGHFAFGPALGIGALLAVWLQDYLLVSAG
ncbi:MAG: prepilin peptidase [Actinomycetia bacterium]|nr:prepilin peptidase [Actinomycetes bacterium]